MRSEYLHPLGADGRPPIEATIELGEAFNPVCLAVANGIAAEVAAERTSLLYQAAKPSLELSFPAREEYKVLVWDILEPLTLEEVEAAQRITSEDERASMIQSLRDSYLQAHPDIPLGTGNSMTYFDIVFERTLGGYLFGGEVFGDRVEPLNARDWKQYEATISRLSPEAQYDVALMQANRFYNTGPLKFRYSRPSQQRADSFFTARHPNPNPEGMTSRITLPVGEYGESFTRELVETTLVLDVYAQQHAADVAAVQTVGNEDLMMEYTARASQAGHANADTTLATVQEGILTIAQVLALLTAKRVPGYDEPHALVADLVHGGHVERLTRYASMGLVGPMNLEGLYIPDVLARDEHGDIGLSKPFTDFLLEVRKEYVEKVAKPSAARLAIGGISRMIGRVCPVTGKDGGLQALAEAHVLLQSARAGR
jgi:hypothetical protein